MSESSEFREALAVAGVKYLVFIRREGNDASIDAVFQRARNVVSQNNPEGWGAFLVNEPASLDDDLLQLVVGGDDSIDAVILSRGEGTSRTVSAHFHLNQVDEALEMIEAFGG
jgi:hypothetical protein